MEKGDRYQEFEPPAALRPFVRTIWTYAAPAPEPTVQRIAPDGCPDLILVMGAPCKEQDEDGTFRLQPQALSGGQARSTEWNFTAAPLNTRCPL